MGGGCCSSAKPVSSSLPDRHDTALVARRPEHRGFRRLGQAHNAGWRESWRVRASPCLWTFDLKRCVATQDFEVVVEVEQGRRSSNGNGSDEAVDELSHCFSMPATRAVQGGCVFVVRRFGGQ